MNEKVLDGLIKMLTPKKGVRDQRLNLLALRKLLKGTTINDGDFYNFLAEKNLITAARSAINSENTKEKVERVLLSFPMSSDVVSKESIKNTSEQKDSILSLESPQIITVDDGILPGLINSDDSLTPESTISEVQEIVSETPFSLQLETPQQSDSEILLEKTEQEEPKYEVEIPSTSSILEGGLFGLGLDSETSDSGEESGDQPDSLDDFLLPVTEPDSLDDFLLPVTEPESTSQETTKQEQSFDGLLGETDSIDNGEQIEDSEVIEEHKKEIVDETIQDEQVEGTFGGILDGTLEKTTEQEVTPETIVLDEDVSALMDSVVEELEKVPGQEDINSSENQIEQQESIEQVLESVISEQEDIEVEQDSKSQESTVNLDQVERRVSQLMTENSQEKDRIKEDVIVEFEPQIQEVEELVQQSPMSQVTFTGENTHTDGHDYEIDPYFLEDTQTQVPENNTNTKAALFGILDYAIGAVLGAGGFAIAYFFL